MNGLPGAGTYGIAIPKHSPYPAQNISVAILTLQKASLLDSLWRKWFEHKSQCAKDNSKGGVYDVAISILSPKHFQSLIQIFFNVFFDKVVL